MCTNQQPRTYRSSRVYRFLCSWFRRQASLQRRLASRGYEKRSLDNPRRTKSSPYRVLDDNRELFIPETQETVKANPRFMLFATQNPPGSYGGRKMLSRAFRNRFVELHFNEIPPQELEFILHKRCQMAPSYSKKMISVMTDLQVGYNIGVFDFLQ